MKNNKENWLITGANGFVGKNLTEKILGKYTNVNLFTPSSKELDLRNFNETHEYIKKNRISMVIHLAAKMAGIGELTEKPLEYLEDNILINFNVVKASYSNNVNRFVTFGSSCGFSKNVPIPMKESYFWNNKPENTYGVSKLILLEHLQSQYKMDWLYLVPANVYGVGDHFDKLRSHVIPATILKFKNAIEKNKDTIDVWGDGSQIRDFIYIDDLTNILCKFIDLDYWDEKIINIATGQGVSIKEIVHLIQSHMGLEECSINWDLDKPTGIPIKVLENSKLMKILKEYNFIDIGTGIAKTLNWYNSRI